jgi:hypothetical protein
MFDHRSNLRDHRSVWLEMPPMLMTLATTLQDLAKFVKRFSTPLAGHAGLIPPTRRPL